MLILSLHTGGDTEIKFHCSNSQNVFEHPDFLNTRSVLLQHKISLHYCSFFRNFSAVHVIRN